MNPFYSENTLKFLFILILAFILTPNSPSYAAMGEENASITGEERAVFAYFKLGKKSPDYERWIQADPLYNVTAESKKIQYLIQESLRLDAGFGAFDLDYDPLLITLDIQAKITTPDENGKSFFMSEFMGIDMTNGQIPTFNFKYADEKIVLVVFDLTKLETLPLTKKQLSSITEKTDEFDSFFPARLTLHIRPSEADHETPLISDEGKIQWLMSGKIAYMRCSFDDLRTGEDDKQLWDYVAPWYKDIYKDKTAPKAEEYPDPFAHLKKD